MKRMFVVPALLLAMSVSSQVETSLVMTRVDGGMQELRNLCLESEHFDIRKCFFLRWMAIRYIVWQCRYSRHCIWRRPSLTMALQVQENKICFMCEFWHLGGCEVSGMFFYCEIFKRHILFVVVIGLPLYCLFFNQ